MFIAIKVSLYERRHAYHRIWIGRAAFADGIFWAFTTSFADRSRTDAEEPYLYKQEPADVLLASE